MDAKTDRHAADAKAIDKPYAHYHGHPGGETLDIIRSMMDLSQRSMAGAVALAKYMPLGDDRDAAIREYLIDARDRYSMAVHMLDVFSQRLSTLGIDMNSMLDSHGLERTVTWTPPKVDY